MHERTVDDVGVEKFVVGQQEVRREVPGRMHSRVRRAVEQIRLVEQGYVATRRIVEHRLIPHGRDEPVRVLEIDLDQGQAERIHLAPRQPSRSWRVACMAGMPPRDIAYTGVRPAKRGCWSSSVGHASA